MLSEALFVVSFIWIGTSAASVIAGPWIGFDAQENSKSFNKHWNTRPANIAAFIAQRLVLSAVFVGFFFPATKPILGFLGAILGFILLGIIR
jgi:hypothetical protein